MSGFVDMAAPLAIGLVGLVIVLAIMKLTSKPGDDEETDRENEINK